MNVFDGRGGEIEACQRVGLANFGGQHVRSRAFLTGRAGPFSVYQPGCHFLLPTMVEQHIPNTHIAHGIGLSPPVCYLVGTWRGSLAVSES
jgi:hypothetical protein